MRKLYVPIVLFTLALAKGQTTATVTVANYAGYTGTFPVAPGSIASAYGQFGNITTTTAPTLNPMPKELAGVRVRVNNIDAPLYFVSAGQINFVIPNIPVAAKLPVEVVSGGTVVASGSVNLYEVGPGLAVSNTTTMQGIVQNQDFSVNSATSRAKRGEVVQIYATGCGEVRPAVQDGLPPAGLSPAVAPVKVFVSVDEAAVSFAGAHPLFPGICQVNATVPDKPYITGQVPLRLTATGVSSNSVTVWVE